jgi:hypothetical protein
VVFVADSQAPAVESNKESFQNLIDNLKEQGADLERMPHVIQWNKRDTPNALPVEELDRAINRFHCATFEASAIRGQGVRETLQGVAKLVLQHLTLKYGGGPTAPPEGAPRVIAPQAPAPQILPPAPPPPPAESAAETARIQEEAHKPLEVEELGVEELMEELEDFGRDTFPGAEPGEPHHPPRTSTVDVPVVLDRSLFSGDGPVEIRLKLYIK